MIGITGVSALEILGQIVARGVRPATVRVSSAKAQGKAGKYPYWGTAIYEIRARKADGVLVAVCVDGASSDRRSTRLAGKDADDIAERRGATRLERIGALSEDDAASVLRTVLTQCCSA